MEKNLAVHIRNLSKVYQYNPKLNQNLRERIFENQNLPNSKTITALNNINLDLEKGSVLGIIGDNGSGKSTLLKLISGITKPNTGYVEIDGRVASILEVGTGFHPDLTGKENIYLSGALMGMKRPEIDSKFDIIVDFSEIGEYIDLAVKHYSSGMFMRLAFSVVAHLNADIILLDEVFSVGDFTFRQKSLDKVIDLSKSHRTLVLVSHDLNSLERACDHILELEDGHMVNFGHVSQVINKYVETKILSTIEDDEEEEEDDGADEDVENVEEVVEVEDEANTLSTGETIATVSANEAYAEVDEENGEVEVQKKVEDTSQYTALMSERDDLRKKLQVLTKQKQRLPKKFSAQKKWSNGLKSKKEDMSLYELSCIASNSKPPIYEFEDELTLSCDFEKNFEGKVGIAFLLLYNLEVQVFAAYSGYSNNQLDINTFNEKGRYQVECAIPSRLLNSGIYSVSIFFIDEHLKERFSLMNKVFFKIAPKENIQEQYLDNDKYNGALKPSFEWKVKIT